MRTDHLAFFSSLFLSRLADQILLFLVPLVVFQTTQSAAWSGLAFFVETLPRFLAFPVCGALCDRMSPLKLLRISQMLRAFVCIGGVVAAELLGGIGWLVALSALCGVLTTQGLMAREVMLPQVFRDDRLEKVLAHAQIADQLGMVLGPLLAALALGWWPWQGVVAATAALFLLADAAMGLWRRVSTVQLAAPQSVHGQHWAQPIKTALVHVWHLPGLMQLIVLAAGVNLVVGVTLATSAVMVTGQYQRSGDDYAVLQMAGAVATVSILLVIARTALPLKTMGPLSYVCILLGGLLTAYGTGLWSYAAGFLLVVGFDKMFSVYIRSRRQKVIPAADLGKTTGVIVLLNNLTQPLAGLVVGVFAGQGDTRQVIIALTLGAGLLGAMVLTGDAWHRLRT
ncbi:MFS transporter [Rhodoferax ferrireducens]|uniref:MFS transporter n=1 Tax=Rhodoferax ferrireducens TaxID=192843 RepID=UPI000E0DFAB8|nr:MFS transporter [Rhodoferax ferrireducens]